ncbi:MAG TPA: dihydrofolate reductase, partial [Steroidobacteraceae bacterium]|nr:dihydrofolate reductase [Steroidobacteraceae bacterium]
MISIIVAAAENGAIGSDNRLPWHLPDDLKRFKALSLGKPIVMGRRTFDSIGRPLPGRTNIVVSRQAGLAIEGVRVVQSLDAALAAAGSVPEIVVIGGAQVFEQALPRTDTIHLTRVHAHIPGD